MWRPESPIGITATVPVEILFAAGRRPVDLNNLFITSPFSTQLISQAESVGFSHNICAWIKGIYAVVMDQGIQTVVAVTGGDCSNTIALGELLARRGVDVIPFEYPVQRNREALLSQMEALRSRVPAPWPKIEGAKVRLDSIRAKLALLDRLTYQENVVTGEENHLFLVNSSDFEGDPDAFEARLDEFLAEARTRKPMPSGIRLGYLGVPPIFSGFYTRLEAIGARVVFNEVQRQFSMPAAHDDILEQYLAYTYPYPVEGRITDIRTAVDERRLDGLIHYTQTFCYRQIYDMILRESLPVPILTLEGDQPGAVDGRTALRMETFVEMLRADKGVDI
jgi:benzoyl-CoA reductase/2-hydroxyglutaryl-CoA dehydratase subunit BcrC/BadD/HgdB